MNIVCLSGTTRLLLPVEQNSILLVLPRAVGLIERADSEVDDKCICAVFLSVEGGAGCWVDVRRYLNKMLQPAGHRRKEKGEKIFFKLSNCK